VKRQIPEKAEKAEKAENPKKSEQSESVKNDEEPRPKKMPKFPGARMFHPHNGREGFSQASSTLDLQAATVNPNLPQATKLREFLEQNKTD
jgi:hypothetical protein